jgi:hypothetical protein
MSMNYLITVKTLTGRLVPLVVNDDTTILEIKEMISHILKIGVNQQRYVFKGKHLEDIAIKNYNIMMDDTIFIHFVLKAG